MPDTEHEPAAERERSGEEHRRGTPGAEPEAKAKAKAKAKAPTPVPAGAARGSIGSGPGKLLVTVYGIFTVGAASRSIVQLSTRFHEAPLAYLLSAVAAVVYAFITVSLVRGGERARKAALGCCCLELLGVLAVGSWTLVEPSAFPDATVWSDYGMGYLFIPVVLPVTGLLWLRASRRAG